MMLNCFDLQELVQIGDTKFAKLIEIKQLHQFLQIIATVFNHFLSLFVK